MVSKFVHFRVHTAYSLSESTLGISKLAELAQNDGQPAMAITDSQNLFGGYEFSKTMAQSGIQPIIGASIFLNDENEPYLSLEPSSTGISNFNYPFNESFYLIINLAIGGEFDNNLIDPSAMCFNRECSNHDDPNSRRFIIDWIEYAKLD